MNKALKEVLKADKGRLADLREIFEGAKAPEFKNGFDFQSVNLNTGQNRALTKVFNGRDICHSWSSVLVRLLHWLMP